MSEAKRPTSKKLGFRWFEQANTYMDYLEAEIARLRGLIDNVATSGVAMDDKRIGYVTVQIDREDWEAAIAVWREDFE